MILRLSTLMQGGLEVIEGDELAKALAQIVWTLTETGDLDSIIISIEGEIKHGQPQQRRSQL